jgi:hypothetical protein
MYSLWGIDKLRPEDSAFESDTKLQKMRTYLFIELATFHLQIFAGAFFLFYIQCKGCWKGSTVQPTSDRHKCDALSFYMQEISWFVLIFVATSIHFISFDSNLTASTSEPAKLIYSGVMIVARLTQFYFLVPLKDYYGDFKERSNWLWIIYGAVELIALMCTFGFKHYRGITTATSFIELSVFFGQYLYYTYNIRKQKGVKETVEQQTQNIMSNITGRLSDSFKNKIDGGKLLLDKPKVSFCVEDSIYNFAILSMIHPNVIKSWPKKGNYATGFKLSLSERESVFQGAVQMIVI